MASYILGKVVLLIMFVTSVQACKSCKCNKYVKNGCAWFERRPSFESIGFTKTQEPAEYKTYDWGKLTTVIIYQLEGEKTKKLACYAHSKHVKVLLRISPPRLDVIQQQMFSRRSLYYYGRVTTVDEYGLDGVDVFFDQHGTVPGFTRVMVEMRQHIRSYAKHPSRFFLTMQAQYCTSCKGSASTPFFCTNFNHRLIQNHIDFFIIMFHDMQKDYDRRLFRKCQVKPDTPYYLIEHYIKEYIQANVNPQKMVITLPWYGYKQKCEEFSNSDLNCTTTCQHLNNEHSQVCYKTVMDTYHAYHKHKGSFTNMVIDTTHFKSLSFFIKTDGGEIFKFHSDNIESLREKYTLAKKFKLGGVAAKYIDCVGFDAKSISQGKAFWRLLKPYSYS